ncbi:MAG: oligosaccharide flippase family protein, partial [Candidatus Micrarchaeia archaeon]
MRRKIISFAYSLLSPIAPVISSLAPKRSRTRSTIVVSFAEIASYALVFLAGLVVLWFLDPEEYASKALVFAIVGVFSVTSDMGIGTAAIRLGSINEKKAKDFVTTAGIARLAFGTIMFLAYFALAPLISDFYG